MVAHALENYGFKNLVVAFLRHNENMTYKITDGGKSYVLRVHKPTEGMDMSFLRMGKTLLEHVTSEMELLQSLRGEGSLGTQKVICNKYGSFVSFLEDGTPVTVLEWIEGDTLDNMEISPDTAEEIGKMIGRLHTDVSKLTIKGRYSYDFNMLSRMITEVDNACTQGHYATSHVTTMKDTIEHIQEYFSHTQRNFILTHADLGKSNLVWNDGRVVPIDFSLSGYCIPEMDIASVFSHINDETLNPNILRGYQSTCEFIPDEKGIAACFCFQILLFLTAQHNRIAGEPWLSVKMDDWCEGYFRPLLGGRA